MKTAETITPKAVELLSRITGERLDTRNVTSPVLFLTALITVLLGVMFADQAVTEEEKQRWQKTLNRFIPAEGNFRQLAQLLSKGVREQKVYANSQEVLTLLEPFSESKKLLIIGFGYEMSAADGSIDESEKKYLQRVATLVGLKSSHVEVLEAGFTKQPIADLGALAEVRSLLDPARFHELDTLFVEAANDLLLTLPGIPAVNKLTVSDSQVTSYDRLKKFQTSRKHLDFLCNQLHGIIQASCERGFLPNNFIDDVGKISRKLQSQRFRVAVVGEFSQGKSTLLNALLGEELQPVRAIPCSGVITTLRYGKRKQVICRYKDGREEEISVEDYKTKASISKSAAVNNHGDELASSEIDELIFEHPDLELCKSGVEILDSPGLNEHPDRTAITEKLLKNTDAALFLTNASRLLPAREKELIEYVRTQATSSNNKLPAENLFVLVNFMDLLDTDEDRQDVTQRLEDFIISENLIVANKNRVHYISAKAALKKQDEYLQSFRAFTQALEQFLVVERGAIEIRRFADDIKDLTQIILAELQQAEDFLDGKVALSQAETQRVLEQIGEASGRDRKIRLLHNKVLALVDEETNNSLNQWLEGLGERLLQKSEDWTSEYSGNFQQKELVADYANQFNRDLSEELDNWIENQLKKDILQPYLNDLDDEIRKNLEAIQSSFANVDALKNSQSSSWAFYQHKSSEFGDSGFGTNLGLAGLGVAVLVPAVILAGPILFVLGILLGGSLFGAGATGILDKQATIKAKVFEKGWEHFLESLDKTSNNIYETIGIEFRGRIDQVDSVISGVISLYENLLEQQETTHQKNLEQREAEKAWIAQQHLELEQLRDNVEMVIKN